jgi:hypothetical protein
VNSTLVYFHVEPIQLALDLFRDHFPEQHIKAIDMGLAVDIKHNQISEITKQLLEHGCQIYGIQYSHAKILLSKYLTALTFSLYGLLVSSIIAIIIATLAAGINESDLTPLLFPFLLQIGLKLFSLLIYTCAAFLASLLSRNHFLSILVSIIFMMFTNPLIPVIPGL